jgi:hypothetical protein
VENTNTRGCNARQTNKPQQQQKLKRVLEKLQFAHLVNKLFAFYEADG